MKILLSVAIFCIFIGFHAFAYQLSETDYDLLDRVEERLFTMIETDELLTAKNVEALIEKTLERKLSERTTSLLEIILDDLRYEYYLGDYSETANFQSEEDCYEDEYFDELDQRCYYNDEDYSYDNEEDFIGDDYRDESNFDYSDYAHTHTDENYYGYEGEEEEILATYIISADTITLISGKTDPKYENAWNKFSAIIPENMRTDFKKYMIFDDKNAGTAAHVTQDEQDHTKWNLTVNISAVYEGQDTLTKEGIATLIHEYAHVLTLNKTQMRYAPISEDEGIYDRFAKNCQNRMVQEGCLNADAYLDDFIDTFWNDPVELKKAQEDDGDVYAGNESNFITDYAATNPGEDIAESFTYFVLNTKPLGITGADNKVNFFYDYKELENLRKQIRSNMEAISK